MVQSYRFDIINRIRSKFHEIVLLSFLGTWMEMFESWCWVLSFLGLVRSQESSQRNVLNFAIRVSYFYLLFENVVNPKNRKLDMFAINWKQYCLVVIPGCKGLNWQRVTRTLRRLTPINLPSSDRFVKVNPSSVNIRQFETARDCMMIKWTNL